MTRPRATRASLGRAAVLALLLAGCANEAPPPEAAAPTPPPPVGWRAIPSLHTTGDIVDGYVQIRGLVATGPVRRAWILLNLRESIPIPETGGRAQSVRFLGEYRCAARQWRPIEGAWFARPNAQDPVHAERPRGAGFRPAEPGTLGGSFLDAACGL
ncbi:surface-adhesin E family protein [Roseomonas rosulenta]|uniref:surface-adhesin E family protein n=1 Tax=Roseomonas rosulenta TaxID=2748667 RepID=UPI0018E04A92|nr:surface-adhesin E family protein [Roseomonas rosulenta]